MSAGTADSFNLCKTGLRVRGDGPGVQHALQAFTERVVPGKSQKTRRGIKYRFPLCHGCRSRGHLNKDCSHGEHSSIEEESKEDNADGVSMSGSTFEIHEKKTLYM